MEQNEFSRQENLSFWKNLIVVGIFFTLTPITLGISLFSLFSLKTNTVAKESLNYSNLLVSPQSGIKVYASLPTKFPTVNGSVEATDARSAIINKYLIRYNSPLIGHEDFIVKTSDKYSLDFRLIPAIAQQESNLCKIIPPESYNCWGWGIHSKGTLGFSSYEEAIESVSKGLREEYLNKGYTTIPDIMSKYTPQSNGSWANGVTQFMSDME
jgi:hypothetical protein